jgi:hypothetical protein
MKHIIISPSMTYDMGLYVCDDEIINTESYCPKKLYRLHVENSAEPIQTQSIKQSNYFKSLCIGTEAEPLERNLNGSKKVVDIRIGKAANNFKREAAKRFINVNDYNQNMPLMCRMGYINVGEDKYCIWLTHTVDVFPTTIDMKELTMIDLRLVKNIEDDFFTPSKVTEVSHRCWAVPQYIAKNEALFSHKLVRNIDADILKQWKPELSDKYDTVLSDQVVKLAEDTSLYYMVFESKESMQFKMVKYNWNENRQKLLSKLVDEAVHVYLECESNKWEAKPSTVNCKNCSISCEFKNIDVVL